VAQPDALSRRQIAQEDKMTTQLSPNDLEPPGATSDIDYHAAEGFAEDKERAWRSWVWVGIGLAALVGVLAVIFSIAALARGGSGETTTVVKTVTSHDASAAAPAKAPTLADSKGVAFEKFQPVDPTLPAVPAGAVKKFTVDVFQHVTQVDSNLAPTEAWSYAVNGKAYRGTAASPPIVVNQGDKVQITFVNGGSKKMNVTMAHSIDFHSAEVAPNKNYIDVAPGKKITIDFVAEHPGVFMYHCATQPVLMHTSAGMMGMMVVKPRNLPPVDKELWLTQEEFYLGQPGKPADMNKMAAETPDVMAFNGYANQYKTNPITVRKGEKIRMYVLDAGPSKWSAFHVIGTVFDTTHVEGVVGHDSQTVSFAPSQGGWVEFTLDQEGNFPFVTHAFGDMVKGAAGILHTTGAPKVAAPKPAAPAADPAAAAKGIVQVSMGDMWIKTPTPTVRAGKVTFQTKNVGATMHGLGIVKAPAKIVNGEPADMLGEGKHLMGGQSDSFTVNLKPGSYELVCHMPGHYAAGQHIPFVVK
jgi:nitrite reductase (NO-forming)